MARTFRISAGDAPLVDAALAAQGFDWDSLPFYSAARALKTGPFPLGSSLAARFGCIYIQDASSMLPALALAGLAGSKGERPLLALDMCASPGGKTSLLAALLGPQALVLGNEPAPKRLATLRRNLELMNALNCATISEQGQELPLPSAQADAGPEGFAGFDLIQLDPPCSGWGTVDKHPQVMELWQGEKLGPLVGLQRLLLREALRLLRPGGALVYSTCTTNVQENEEQIVWALDELGRELDGELALEPLAPFPGFVFDAPLAPLAGQAVLRVPQEVGLGQGFFLAALRKGAAAPMLPPRVAPAKKPKAARSGPAPAHPVARAALDSPLCDLSLLPPGEIFDQNGTLYFKHRAGLEALPETFVWRGFHLGKNMRLDTGLRALMPALDAALERGAAVLDAKDPAEVLALVSGQSLKMDLPAGEAGLYLNGLPLCRLKARGGRVFI